MHTRVCSSQQSSKDSAWKLAARQHGVVSRQQLTELGLSRRAIQHRIDRGRLHIVRREVYAVGRPELSRQGRWMAAVLGCGPDIVLSHRSAAALWGIGADPPGSIEVSSHGRPDIRRPGIRVHRRTALKPDDLRVRDGIPLTAPVLTLIDLATVLSSDPLECAVNEADKLGLVDSEALVEALDAYRGQPGTARLRKLITRHTFRVTDSKLERWFLPIVAEVGLPMPQTRRWRNGYRVDFHWPDLGLVVETDGLRYHRTPSQQATDRVRDQVQTAAGLTPIRFTHRQVRFEPDHVRRILSSVARRLEEGIDGSGSG